MNTCSLAIAFMVGPLLIGVASGDDAQMDSSAESNNAAILEAQINLLKATISDRDKKIESLQKEIEELKAMLAQVMLIDLTEDEASPGDTTPPGPTLRYPQIIQSVWQALTPFPNDATELQQTEQWNRQRKELYDACVGKRANLGGVVEYVSTEGVVHVSYSNDAKRQKIIESNSKLQPHTTGGLRPVAVTAKPKPVPPLERMTVVIKLPLDRAIKLRQGQSLMVTGIIKSITLNTFPGSTKAIFFVELEE